MSKEVRRFQKEVWAYYRQNARAFPWRQTTRAYRILVSEIMLQQTQVDRAVPYYRAFLRRFPTVRALAEASLVDVLVLWQGLGYNRRGKQLHDAAQLIMTRHSGRVPRERLALEALPGIGPYTAGAIRAFSWNEPEVFIETNIRTVLMHHFFPLREKVRDVELLEIAEEVLDRTCPREWYYALMDYGSYLKKNGVRNNSQSAQYKKQSRFAGSNRQLRGQILTLALSTKRRPSEKEIARRLKAPREKVQQSLDALRREGLIS